MYIWAAAIFKEDPITKPDLIWGHLRFLHRHVKLNQAELCSRIAHATKVLWRYLGRRTLVHSVEETYTAGLKVCSGASPKVRGGRINLTNCSCHALAGCCDLRRGNLGILLNSRDPRVRRPVFLTGICRDGGPSAT